MPQCFDVNNVPQDCGAASDSGGSSCFDDTAQEVSCSEVGGYASALDTALVPGITSGPGAANASVTGAVASGRTGGGAVAAPGPSLFSQLLALAPVAANTYSATQQAPPKSTVKIGPGGTKVPPNAGRLLLVAALVVGGGFLYFAGKKKG